jgi:hypothetical protein
LDELNADLDKWMGKDEKQSLDEDLDSYTSGQKPKKAAPAASTAAAPAAKPE